jgi:DTW domain-containing protein YfiP
LPQLANRTPVVILQHPREKNRPIGTVRFAKLGLQRCEVEVYAPWSGQPSTLPERLSPGAAVLFPSAKARAVESLAPEERPTQLLVLDGTWNQVNALVRANPWLEELPHVTLEAPAPSRYRIRAEPQLHYVSTLEAIVATLRALEPETAGFDGLLAAFDAMIDTQINYGGTGEKRFRQPRQRRPAAPAAELAAQADRHVLVHLDTVGPRGAARPIHVCAWRLQTGESLEVLLTSDPQSEGSKLAYLDLPPGAWQTAVSPEEFLRQWQAFLRPGDVAVVWSQRALNLLPMPEATVQLKAAWCNRDHRKAGHLGDALYSHGITADPVRFWGEVGRQLGQMAALRRWLLAHA